MKNSNLFENASPSSAEKLLIDLASTSLHLELKDKKLYLRGGNPEERTLWTARLRPLKEELLALLSKQAKNEPQDWTPAEIEREERSRPPVGEMESWATNRRRKKLSSLKL